MKTKIPLADLPATCRWVFNKPPHTNLLQGWEERGKSFFTNFRRIEAVGPFIVQAENAGNEIETLQSAPFLCEPRQTYKLVVDFQSTSGKAPFVRFGIAENGWYKDRHLVEGLNEFLFVAMIRSEQFIELNADAAGAWSASFSLYATTQCAYTGPEKSCDKTYERCVELGNSDNFGGFRHIPELKDKIYFWGEKEK